MYTCVYIHEVCIHIYIYIYREREIVWTWLCLLTSNVRLVPSYQGPIYLAISHNTYDMLSKSPMPRPPPQAGPRTPDPKREHTPTLSD